MTLSALVLRKGDAALFSAEVQHVTHCPALCGSLQQPALARNLGFDLFWLFTWLSVAWQRSVHSVGSP